MGRAFVADTDRSDIGTSIDFQQWLTTPQGRYLRDWAQGALDARDVKP